MVLQFGPLKGFLLLQLHLSLLSQVVSLHLHTQVCSFVCIRVTMNGSVNLDIHCCTMLVNSLSVERASNKISRAAAVWLIQHLIQWPTNKWVLGGISTLKLLHTRQGGECWSQHSSSIRLTRRLEQKHPRGWTQVITSDGQSMTKSTSCRLTPSQWFRLLPCGVNVVSL